ncbi:unnamed protein product [Calicophoron daubneyi]|uniref:PMP-22/EMP/MP20/Claudin tight junction n=1 Tax=Calicophoron daubneyi TaxID=300641 RepID=A0AAV2TY04_CALDB
MRVKHRIKHTPFSEWRYFIVCVLTFVTFALELLCFVTPYWLQSWSRIHTPFLRLGLWEFCLKGYVSRVDSDMVSYYECWWILSPYYSKIFNQLVPFWFLIIQVLASVAVAIQLVLFVWWIVYLCRRVRHVERRSFTLSVMTGGHALTVAVMIPAIIVFGVNYENPDWMPVPKFNWPSWSYGCAILATFSALFCTICFGLMHREMNRDIQEYMLQFPLYTKIKHRRRWLAPRKHWSEDKTKIAAAVVPPVQAPARMPESIMLSEFSQPSQSGLTQYSESLPQSGSQVSYVPPSSRDQSSGERNYQGSEV